MQFRRSIHTGVIASACAAPQCWLLRTSPCCAAVSVRRKNCHAGVKTVMQASMAKCDLLSTSKATPHACLFAASIMHFTDQFDADMDCRRPCRSGVGQHGRWRRSMCLVCDLGSPSGAAFLCPLELEGARSGLRTRVLTKFTHSGLEQTVNLHNENKTACRPGAFLPSFECLLLSMQCS